VRPFLRRLFRSTLRLSPAAALAALVGLAACSRPSLALPTDRDWRVFAIEYGTSSVKRSMLVRGAREGERAAMSWYAWLLVSKNATDRRILVDTGFDDAALEKKWRFTRRDRVVNILVHSGVSAGAITDVVVTHGHWDHVGDAVPYFRARFWIQKAALDAARGGLKAPEGPKEIAPGVALVPGGGHAPGIQWVKVALGDPKGRTVAIASDVVYLYENVEKLIPTGSTEDADADLAAMRAMIAATGSPALILPGHDPLVAKRLSRVAEHVYELK
jgi:glyoxylase-like metal-dependent hydrolase (beta-lactamase superfamily II)